jgi:hypothetical protein
MLRDFMKLTLGEVYQVLNVLRNRALGWRRMLSGNGTAWALGQKPRHGLVVARAPSLSRFVAYACARIAGRELALARRSSNSRPFRYGQRLG